MRRPIRVREEEAAFFEAVRDDVLEFGVGAHSEEGRDNLPSSLARCVTRQGVSSVGTVP